MPTIIPFLVIYRIVMSSNLSYSEVLGGLNVSRVSKIQRKPLILSNKILSRNNSYLIDKLLPDYVHHRFP